jgi:hypothetical protein
VKGLISRTTTAALCVAVTLAAAVVPCAAADAVAAKKAGAIVHLSPASRQLLATAAATPQPQPPSAAPSSPGAFFKSTRGKVTLALMGAGAGFALYSIHHDRIPVKSPVR